MIHQSGLSCRIAPVFGNPGVAAAPELDPEPELEPPGITGGATAAQLAEEIVSPSVLTVPPNASALPVQLTVSPIVIPDAAISVPTKREFAPRVVAAPGVHHASQA